MKQPTTESLGARAGLTVSVLLTLNVVALAVTGPSTHAAESQRRTESAKVDISDTVMMTDVEKVFYDWLQHATWEDGKTEVAIRVPSTNSFSLFVEVLRIGEVYYFRSIPKLTRPMKPVEIDAPIRFTAPKGLKAAPPPAIMPPKRYTPTDSSKK